jgi:hypothetical protein
MKRLHVYTFSDPMPMPIILLDTAKHDGQYLCSNYTSLYELDAIYSTFGIKVTLGTCGFRRSVRSGVMLEADGSTPTVRISA